MSLGTNIKSIRNNLSLSQLEFAKQMGVSITTLQNWETDKKKPSYDNLIKMRNTFNITYDDILKNL